MLTVEAVVYDLELERDAEGQLDYAQLRQNISGRVSELVDQRNALVQDYTGRMQAATLPKTVLKMSLKLSELVFKLDQEIFDLEAILEGLEAEGNETLTGVTDREQEQEQEQEGKGVE